MSAGMLYEKHREFGVYPGHPLIIAYEIMLAFEGDLDKAFAPSYDKNGEKLGWCEALSDSRVSGAGGCVHNGVRLLKYIQDGVLTPLEALDWCDGLWAYARSSDFADRIDEGQEQAERYKGHALEQFLTIQVRETENPEETARLRKAVLERMAKGFRWD